MKPTDYTLCTEEFKQDYCQKSYWNEQTLGQCLREWAAEYGNKTALIDGDLRLSYQDLNQKADKIASGLFQLGIKSGDRVILQMPNSAHFVVVLFALFRIGALPVLTMPAQREKDISDLCALAEPVAYIVADQFLGFDYLKLAETLKDKHPSLKYIIMDGQAGCHTSLAELEVSPISFSEPNPFEPALLLLSGGTTGTPKLIPRTHADYAYNAFASAELCQLNSDTVYLAVLPVAHNFPLACPGILGTLSVGGSVVMARTPGNDEAFPLIEREKVTITSLVPPLVQLWLSARSWEKTDLSSLKVLQVGGSRFESELAKQVTPVLGCQLQQVFGMAEGLLCYTRLDDPQEVIINTQGRPLCPGDEIRVVNIDGELVKPGEVGELQTRGPYTIRAYYRAAQHNATAFSDDGFYQSGDLVRQTESGNIIVEGRIKEQINRAGEKISVAEIEQLLNEHPDISSSVLVAAPDKRLGERSCAFIITSNPLSLSEIRQYLNEKGLSRYKWPDQLEVVTSWPLTAVGKVDKKHLLAQISKPAKQTPSVTQYAEYRLPICSNPMELALKIVQSQNEQVYAIYERNGEWSVGLGRYASICADAHQAEVRIDADNKHQQESFKRERLCEAISEATKSIPIINWRAYGAAKFELSHVFFGLESENEATRNLLELFIPSIEVRLTQEQALIRTIDAEQLAPLIKLVQRLDHECLSQEQESLSSKVHADIREHRQDEYKSNVKDAVAEIQSGQYQKVILSRRIPLPPSVDLIESYRNGRLNNTPARSFLVSYGHEKLAGFSPETVVEVSAEGLVSTQPLAGTRALGSCPKEEQELREELLADSKEIAEHAMSVKRAQEELENICEKESISICEFMAIRRRGSVQHLASRLTGQLAQGKNAWDAFESLFPAVTASGIPKKESIDAIKRFESEAREWYSGCVMILDSNGSMDAALVLRSIYQRGELLWLQAGAGIIAQSKPERELEETIEKLSCISQHLLAKKSDGLLEKVECDLCL